MPGLEPRPCVLVAAARARWEPDVLAALAGARMVVLRRCVDIVDLLGAAGAGAADAAIVAADLDGLDAESVRALRAADVRVVAVAGTATERDRMARLGVAAVDASVVVPAVEEALSVAEVPPRSPWAIGDDRPLDDLDPATDDQAGRIVAVWGAAGAPGRSTVATALAAERAVSGRRVVLCDVDPYAGTLAQSLGILDETSGLLALARALNEGLFDARSLTASLRSVPPGLDVLTGLPRPERWVEVRAGVVESVAGLAASFADVVLDCGFGLGDPGSSSTPERVTDEAIACADHVVVVGSAEPTGLSRLARALVELDESGTASAGVPVTVVVNRMRASLGWRLDDVAGMVADVAPGAALFFWPYERAALDRASVRGVALPELGDTPLRDCAREMLERVFDAALMRDQVPNNR